MKVKVKKKKKEKKKQESEREKESKSETANGIRDGNEMEIIQNGIPNNLAPMQKPF